jgi:hypothetical protein
VPISVSDFDSPEHHGHAHGSAPANLADEASGLWSSPHHEWQDQRLPKYKMALYSGGKSRGSSVSEIRQEFGYRFIVPYVYKRS